MVSKFKASPRGKYGKRMITLSVVFHLDEEEIARALLKRYNHAFEKPEDFTKLIKKLTKSKILEIVESEVKSTGIDSLWDMENTRHQIVEEYIEVIIPVIKERFGF